jgi:hypothetical protein
MGSGGAIFLPHGLANWKSSARAISRISNVELRVGLFVINGQIILLRGVNGHKQYLAKGGTVSLEF